MKTILDILDIHKNKLIVDNIIEYCKEEEYSALDYNGQLTILGFNIFNKFIIRDFNNGNSVWIQISSNKITYQNYVSNLNKIIKYLGKDSNKKELIQNDDILFQHESSRFYQYDNENQVIDDEIDEGYFISMIYSFDCKFLMEIGNFDKLLKLTNFSKNWC